MSRATPFNRLDVERRSNETLVEPALIERLVKAARITDRDERGQFEYKLNCTIQAYRARVLADKQERPAKIVAALEPGLKSAKECLAWFDALPVGVLSAQQAGDIRTSLDAIISTIENRLVYWQQHVAANRPAGEGAASLDLRRSLTDIITAHWPDVPDATQQQKRFNERERRGWVAFACSEIGAKYPDEKKNRRRFIGERKPEAPPTPNAG